MLTRCVHYGDVIMGAMASQITSLTIVYSIVYSNADQRKHQSSASLAFVWGIHRDRWITRTMAGNAENVSISWRHHVIVMVAMLYVYLDSVLDLSKTSRYTWRAPYIFPKSLILRMETMFINPYPMINNDPTERIDSIVTNVKMIQRFAHSNSSNMFPMQYFAREIALLTMVTMKKDNSYMFVYFGNCLK